MVTSCRQPHRASPFIPASLSRWRRLAIVLAAAAVLATGAGYAAPAASPPDYTIHLLNGKLGPDFAAFAADRATLGASASASAADPARFVHVLVQLDRIPGVADRAELGGLGVTLHSYISNYAWIASLPEAAVNALANRPIVRFLKRWEAADKLHPRVAAGEIGPWARDDSSGLVNLIVAGHGDVSLADLQSIIEQAGGTAVYAYEAERSWSAWVPEVAIAALAQDERVYWIEEVSPPLDELNDGARADLNVDTVHQAPYNLSGNGTSILVFDGGLARTTHEKLAGHITAIDSAAVADHSTHVACTAAGDRTPDNRANGMAHGAWILTAGYSQGSGVLFYDAYGDMITDYSTARNDATHPADLATNSIGSNVASNGYNCALEGTYGQSSRMIDRITRGDESGIAGAYKRYIVTWAAGNERTGGTTRPGQCGGGYFTTPPPCSAKNPIHVGATNSDYDSMSNFSSWGPTDNGRLKPTVTGPGCESGVVEAFIYSALSTSDTAYGGMCGTSMATPAVAGVVGLILEQYRAINGGTSEPWNAAIKALLIHTAKDLGAVGPDYMTGYGRVDAKAAIDLLLADAAGSPAARFHDVLVDAPASVSQGSDVTWAVTVPAGTKELKASLAWDDYFASAPSDGAIVNNLDLWIVAPDSTVYRPWLLNAASPWLAATKGVNSVDNQEQVVVTSPAAGIWTIHVAGTAVPQGPQSFGLVYTYAADSGATCSRDIDFSPAARNGGFESAADWTLAGGAAIVATQAHSGTRSLELAGANSVNESAYQTITIPADAERANLSYWWRALSADNWSGYDFLRVEVRSTADVLLANLDIYHNGVMVNAAGGFDAARWAPVDIVDLLPWKGQTIRLYLRGTTDGVDVTTFWVDDVRLEICTPGSCAYPTGLGNNSAADVSACADTGVAVTWSQDPGSWGDGGAGTRTYDVLRNGSAIASALAYGTTAYTDTTGVNGTGYTYATRYNNGCGRSATAAGAGAGDAIDCSCLSAPTFAGLSSVTPLPASTLCGLHLTWSAGTSNCANGPGLTYTLYRRTGVNPFAAIATCVTGLGYDDTTAATAVSYDYMVRAEDSTAAANGPCNHGNPDVNAAVVPGVVPLVFETGQQVVRPLDATSGSATSSLSPAFSLSSPVAASLSYSPAYISGGTAVDLFGPDDDPYYSGNWTTAGGLIQTVTHCSRSTAYYRINQGAETHLVTGISTVGYTNVRVIFDYQGIGYVGGDQLSIEYSTNNGGSWQASGWTGNATTWQCGVSAALPAGAAGAASLLVRFTNTSGGPTRRAGVDYVIIRADTVGGSGTWTANARVELIDPSATATVLKAYGAADANPYNVLPYYTGLGTYQVRVSDNAGGVARVTSAVLNVQGPVCRPGPAQNVQSFTARATNGANRLEWQNPGASYGSTRVCWSTVAYPANPTACGTVNVHYVDVAGSAGGYGNHTHTAANGTPVYYTAFVNNGAGAYSSGRNVKATPFATPVEQKWAYATGASALAPPGVERGGAYFAVSNDRMLHAMNGTPAGGNWPRTAPYAWFPSLANGPVQHQPPVVPLSSATYVYLASQDGYAYAFDAHTGARLWTSNDGASPVPNDVQLGTMLQADPVGLFAEYMAGAPDRVFVGTRNGSAANSIHALNPVTGQVIYSWNNGYAAPGDGKGIGIITGMSVDYFTTPYRVYFASRALAGGSGNTLWCLNVTSSGATLHRAWAVGDIDGAPVACNGRIYVGTNAGVVYCIDPDNATPVWSYSTGDGPVKGYVYPDFGSPLRLYFSTSAKIWALDGAGALISGWPATAVASPTTPQLLFGTNFLLTGSSSGRLYQIDVTTPGNPAPASVLLGSGQLGAVALDTADPANIIAIVGSTAGVVHAVKVPL